MPTLDWLVVGDVALQHLEDKGRTQPILGGAGARLAAHGAGLGARVALVAKTGRDAAGERVRSWLEHLHVDLQWLGVSPGHPTTVWHEPKARPESRRIDRGADLTLRLDEVPPVGATRARLTIVSGYSLSIEPARAAALGALRVAGARGGSSALLLEAELLWWTNPRMTRKVLEPALRAAHSVALTAADARTLFGPRVALKDAVREVSRLGPRVVYLSDENGGAVLQDGRHFHSYSAGKPIRPADPYAGPAAFWVAQARGVSPVRSLAIAVRHAHAVQRPGAPRSPRRRAL